MLKGFLKLNPCFNIIFIRQFFDILKPKFQRIKKLCLLTEIHKNKT